MSERPSFVETQHFQYLERWSFWFLVIMISVQPKSTTLSATLSVPVNHCALYAQPTTLSVSHPSLIHCQPLVQCVVVKKNVSCYVPMIYMTPYVILLMRADTLRGQVGGGWALEIETFWALWNGIKQLGKCHFFGAQKVEIYRAQPPSTCPSNGFARMKTILCRAISIRGQDWVVLCTWASRALSSRRWL